jgi:hypothetical protein
MKTPEAPGSPAIRGTDLSTAVASFLPPAANHSDKSTFIQSQLVENPLST